MNIKDFILTEEPVIEKKEKQVKKKSAVLYTILASNEMDFVVEKKSPRTKAIMAIIPSKEQYYINNIVKNGNDENAEPMGFTAESIRWFLNGLEEPFDLPVDWCDKLEKGMEYARALKDFLSEHSGLIKLGLAEFGKPIDTDILYIYETSPKLALFLAKAKKTVPQMPPIVDRWSSFQPFACGSFDGCGIAYLGIMEQIFGLDSTRNFVNAFIDRDLNFSCDIRTFENLINNFYLANGMGELLTDNRRGLNYSYRKYDINTSLFSKNLARIDMKAFTDYCLTYQREGFTELRGFFQALMDDWRMQGQLSNCVREKYPRNLATHHNQLIMKYKFVSTEIDKEKFTKYYKAQKKMEWQNDEYIVKVPETVEDMVDEAIQQNNCLRSYICRVLEGQTTIFFLRKKKDPEKSLVTLEVNNGEVVQAKAHFNKTPSHKEMEAVREWAEAKKIIA